MNPAKSYLGIWFGNFFEPFYSHREAVTHGLEDVAALGFNSVNLDAKPWADFFARYRGEPASPYVAMQEFMLQEMARLGLEHTHLALYLCGDNLYPTIRDVPPVRGEEAVRPDGQPMGTYKYWSPRAQETMVEHVRGLLKLYGQNLSQRDGRRILMSMFEPIPKPSFDAEGRQKYLAWLERHYAGDLARFNQHYALTAKSFNDLQPAEYWLRPEALSWVGCARPTAKDFADRTPDFYRWVDNQTHLAEVLGDYLATMRQRWRELDPNLFIEPILHQWGYFFNPPGQTDWQTGQRALDVYRCAAHVDSVLFVSAPLNAENRPDAMALSVEGSILRAANSHRPFTAGLYLGRHVNGDIYRVVPPAEAIATHVANGAQGLFVYGYSGLDDGGVMFRMDALFKESLRTGNHWAAEVMPLLSAPRTREVALLFPAEMSLYEPVEVDLEGRHRMDLLGWYQQFTDLGWHVDILHPDQVAAGALAHYQHLVVPHNSLYDLGDNAALESAVQAFVAQGGTVFHGPHCELARRALGIVETPHAFDCLSWKTIVTQDGTVFHGSHGELTRRTPEIEAAHHAFSCICQHEEIIPHGWSTVAFASGQPMGTYLQTSQTAIAQSALGQGRVYSFGFQYGYSYCRRTMPIVPSQYGKREMHPVVLLEQTPVAALAGTSPSAPMASVKGVEFARFGNHYILVNHRSSPVDISGLKARRQLAQVPSAPGWLAAHSGGYFEV